MMAGLVFHYLLGCVACELHFGIIGMYCKHHFINQTLDGSLIRAFFGVIGLVIVKKW